MTHWSSRGLCLVLDPSTALYRPFLKHSTLTNKAVRTIWRALSKPLHRRQGPDLRPLWLLVGTPSAVRPELAFSRAEHSLSYSDVTIYVYILSIIYHLCFTCIDFYDLSAWSGCWFVVYIRRFIYKFLNECPFDYTAVAGSGKVGPVNQVNDSIRFARCCTSVSDFNSKNLKITSKLLTQGYRYHKLRKTFGKFFRSYSDLLSKFGEISFQEYVTEVISHPVFYGDLVYKLRRVKCEANFVSSGSNIVKRLRRRKYDPVIIEDDMSCVWPFYSLVQIFPQALHSD